MPELSPATQRLIQKYQTWYQSQQPKTGFTAIHVDEVASAVASFYEKIRGVVEWKEEHLLRKAAIERILKRRLILQKNGGTPIYRGCRHVKGKNGAQLLIMSAIWKATSRLCSAFSRGSQEVR